DRVFVDDLVAAHAEEVEQERSDHPGPVLAGGAVEDHTLGAGLRHRVDRLCQPMSELGDHEFVDPAQRTVGEIHPGRLGGGPHLLGAERPAGGEVVIEDGQLEMVDFQSVERIGKLRPLADVPEGEDGAEAEGPAVGAGPVGPRCQAVGAESGPRAPRGGPGPGANASEVTEIESALDPETLQTHRPPPFPRAAVLSFSSALIRRYSRSTSSSEAGSSPSSKARGCLRMSLSSRPSMT